MQVVRSLNENERDEPEDCGAHAQRQQDPVVENGVSSEFHHSDILAFGSVVGGLLATMLFIANVFARWRPIATNASLS